MLEGVMSMKGTVINKLKSISLLKHGFVFRNSSLSEPYFQIPPSSREESGQSELVGCSNKASQIIKDDKKEQEFQGSGGRCQNFKQDIQTAETGEKLGCPGDNNGVLPLPDPIQSSSADQQPLNIKIEQSLSENCGRKTELWEEFEEKCPPGGDESIVLYTTSMRGIRKTFEDCNSIRFLLESFRVEYKERDVSLDLEYRDELWKIMGSKAVPPRLFIRGRYIGGADEVVGLNERGVLKQLLQGIPRNPNNSGCKGCAGVGFVLCFSCNGSRKTISPGTGEGTRCRDCNENGLVKCPICNSNN